MQNNIETNDEILYNILDKLRKIEQNQDTLLTLVPQELSISELANMLDKSAGTLRKYILANFEPDVDFKKKGGKIYVKQDAILRIRRHYAG